MVQYIQAMVWSFTWLHVIYWLRLVEVAGSQEPDEPDNGLLPQDQSCQETKFYEETKKMFKTDDGTVY